MGQMLESPPCVFGAERGIASSGAGGGPRGNAVKLLWGPGSQVSWVDQIPESPPPFHETGAVRGAWERQPWGWRGLQGRQRRRTRLGLEPPLRLVRTEVESEMA